MHEIRFRALAPDKKGNLKWFDDVITDGQEVWIETKHQGIKHLKEIKALVQYTGLKDKNGVEIYEGDVLHMPNKKKSQHVVFKRGFFQMPEYFIDETDEVIGNIYEHPHLLGGE